MKNSRCLAALATARPVAALLRGPIRAARVHSVYPGAAYLSVGGRLFGLTAQDVDRLPFGIQLPVTRQPDRPFLGLQAGAPATVGAGRLRLHSTGREIEIQAGPLWDPRPPVDGICWRLATVQTRVDDLERLLLHPALPTVNSLSISPWQGEMERVRGWSRSLLQTRRDRPSLGGEVWERLRHGLGALESAIRQADEREVDASARRLVGLGPGLTPSGDDALGGLLAAGHFLSRAFAADRQRWRRVGRIVCKAAQGRTTIVGEALLRHAAVGQVGDAVGALLRALGAQDSSSLQSALERTLRIGHTSGADTALGILHSARLQLTLLPDAPAARVSPPTSEPASVSL